MPSVECYLGDVALSYLLNQEIQLPVPARPMDSSSGKQAGQGGRCNQGTFDPFGQEQAARRVNASLRAAVLLQPNPMCDRKTI
ncbi:hypothetical protein SCLCIDRAFT_1220472 [Scleroderma citrinum Foug A]|uniref:Uncharacterized protein n=1 Tax=Scleroderma citrinum Foug A TaxID=1036808 RepID=A0A0C2Z316_9AGAM|nr:hypothetical protein SCLCIDRAFT_1220472 [Scleroderma citrinum Foug A]